jgi:three-Cys-motif partner protein
LSLFLALPQVSGRVPQIAGVRCSYPSPPRALLGLPIGRGGREAKGENTGKREKFFEELRPAGVLKLGIYRRYVPPFVSMTGKWAPNHRVTLLDAYAGPGVYEDGSSGSPALAAETAEALAQIRNLEGYFVEADEQNYRTLCDTLAGKSNLYTYPGRIEDHLPVIMKEIGDAPLFAFFDPFGLTVPMDMLVDEVLARKSEHQWGGPPTELLINFSLPGLRRNAGKKKVPGARKRLDEVLGGNWWRPIWDSGAPDRNEQIVRGYADRLRQAAHGWGYGIIPVRTRWEGPIVYCMILLTSYNPALWLMNQAVSSAMEEFRAFSHQIAGRLDLEPLEDREEKWVSVIADRIEHMVGARGPFRIGDHIAEVYGETLWYARELHVRRAIKRLHAEDKIANDGRGPVERMVIRPTT